MQPDDGDPMARSHRLHHATQGTDGRLGSAGRKQAAAWDSPAIGGASTAAAGWRGSVAGWSRGGSAASPPCSRAPAVPPCTRRPAASPDAAAFSGRPGTARGRLGGWGRGTGRS
jgi:hypothetical protein